MIKYFEYDAFDDHGQHIIPVNSLRDMNKTAQSYSPELMKVILSMKRDPDRYYVVVNALGSYEVWGANRNGDAFPESGLSHKSLRTDMGTQNDYGYKTFEYYAKLYRNHVNKDPKNSYGDVIFSHWNPSIHRVELIVGIDVSKAKDIVDALEMQQMVSVSMGARLAYDRCSICDNKAKRRDQYCIHLKEHMLDIVTPDLAARWSIETGKTIRPGMQVFTYNDSPKFFDISRVYIGADRTAFVLGKAASKGFIQCSIDIGEASGVKDNDIEKLAAFGKTGSVVKEGDIDKEVGALGPSDVDGMVTKSDTVSVIRKALAEKVNSEIVAEPEIPPNVLNSVSSLHPLNRILSTMMGLGIHPKPAEFQRIIIVKIGRPDIADDLESRGISFNPQADSIAPADIDVGPGGFDSGIARILAPFLGGRSCHPSFLEPRITGETEKLAIFNGIIGPDYWLRPSTEQVVAAAPTPSTSIPGIATALAGIAALYLGLKMKSMGMGTEQMAQVFSNQPWLKAMIGGGVVSQLYDAMSDANREIKAIKTPASAYEGLLGGTNFSGHFDKTSSLSPRARAAADAIVSGIILPEEYVKAAYAQKPMVKTAGRVYFGSVTRTAARPVARIESVYTDSTVSDLERGLKNLLK